MYAIGVDDNHAHGQSGFRDFGAWEIIVPEVYNVFEVGEVNGLEEVSSTKEGRTVVKEGGGRHSPLAHCSEEGTAGEA